MTIRTWLMTGLVGSVLATAMPANVWQPSAEARPAVPVPYQRALPLQGGQNFRDLGGYRTTDGRTVRWRVLFRSGAMNELTLADFDYLRGLGIRTVCDLRSSGERRAATVAWPARGKPKIFADDYQTDWGDIDFKKARSWTPDQARAAMSASYRNNLSRFNSQYRRMFQQLLVGAVPLAFNCSAGKDRTGVAAALILTALNVPRETVIQDYLLSNLYFKPKRRIAPHPAEKVLQGVPPAVMNTLMGVEREYIESAFRVIDRHPGGAEGYLKDELGLGKAELQKLRGMYTQRLPGR